MSTEIDERVVEMRFDNKRFEKNVATSMSTLERLKQALKFDGAAKGLEDVEKASKKITFDDLTASVQALEKRFSTLGIVGMRTIERITDSMINLGKRTKNFLTSSITQGGINRAMNLENAHFQLQGLLKDEEAVSAVMKNVNDSVDGTAYSLDAAAKVASQLAASGMRAGDQMFSSLRAVAGVAAMTNSEYDEIGQIFTTVAGNGRLMGDQLLQLSSRGMNATATLAEYLTKTGTGAQVTEADIRDMVSKGKISFETFANAMDDAFGEHAKKANETFTGAMSNVKAALARIGAEFVSPLIVQNGPLVEFFNALRERVNDVKANIGPLSDLFVDSVTSIANAGTKFLKKVDVGKSMKKFEAFASPWDKFISKITEAGISADDFQEKIKDVAAEHDIPIDSLIKHYGSLEKVFSSGKLSVGIIVEVLKEFTTGTTKATASLEEFQDVVNQVIRGNFGNGEARVKALTEAGYDYATVQGLVNKVLAGGKIEIENLSDAQLENLGYTKEQIAAIKKLVKEAEKTGTPLNELIKSLEKPSGRELLIDSARNALGSFAKILGTVGEAWEATFQPMTSEQLYEIIESIHTFSTYLVISDEKADKLCRTLKGLFSILDIILTFTRGSFSIGLKLLCKILKMADVDILDVTASVGDAIVAFDRWLFQNNKVVLGIDKFVKGAENGIKTLKRWIDKFLELPVVQRNIERFQTAFSNTLADAKEYIDSGIEKIDEFIDRVKNMDDITLEDISKIFKDFNDNVLDYFFDVDGRFEDMKSAVKDFKDDIVQHFSEAGGNVDSLKNKIVGFFDSVKQKISDNIGLGELLTIGTGVSLIVSIKQIGNALEKLAKPFSAIGDVVGNFNGVLKSLSSVLQAYTFQIKAEGLMKVAIAIAVLAGSVAVLAMLDAKKLWSAVGALAILSGVLLGISYLSGKLEKIGNFNKTSLSMAGIAAALFILVATLKQMEGLSEDNIWKNIGILAAIAGGLTLLTGILGKIAPQLSKGSFTLVAVAIALKIMVSALEDLDGSNIQNTEKTLKLLAGIIIALGVISKACSGFKMGSAIGVLAAVIALKIFIDVFNELVGMDMGKVRANIASLITVIGAFALVLAVSNLAGKNAAKAGTSILAMSIGLLFIVQAIKMISDVDSYDLKRGISVISLMMWIFSMIMSVSVLAGKNAAKAGTMFLAMSAAILILSGAMVVLSRLDDAGVKRALTAILALEAMFGVLIAVTSLAKECKSTLILISVTIGILAVALGALSMIEPINLAAATGALSVVMGMLALVIASTGVAKNATGALVVLTLVIGVLGGVLFALSGLPVESTLATASGLSMLLLALAASMTIISNTKSLSVNALVSLAAMLVIIASLALMLKELSSLNIGPTLEIAASLSILLLSLSAACLILSGVGATGPAGFIGIGVLAALIVGVGTIITGLGYLATKYENMESFLNKGLPLLEQIGQGLGAFFGNAVGGFLSGVTAGLAEAGTNLSDFMTNLEPFLTGMKSVDASVITGVKSLAEAIMVLSAAEVMNFLTSGIRLVSGWMTGESSLSGFAEELSAFADVFVEYAKKMEGVKPEVINASANAAKCVAEFARAIPNQGGLLSRIVGDNTLGDFAKQLSPFATKFVEYSNTISNIDANVETNSSLAVNAMKGLIEMASSIPNQGGWLANVIGDNTLGDFAKQLSPFAKGLVEYSSIISGVTPESVQASADAAKILVDLADSIPNSGGMWAEIVGDNTLSGFGDSLVPFAEGLVNYSNTIVNLNPDGLPASANMAAMLINLQSILSMTGVISGYMSFYVVGDAIVYFGEKFAAFYNSLAYVDPATLSAVIEKMGDMTEVVGEVDKAIPQMSNAGQSLILGLVSGMKAKQDLTAATMLHVLSLILSAINNRKSTFTESGANIVNGFDAGIKSRENEVLNTVTSMLTRLVSEINNRHIDFYTSGGYLVDGFIVGINENITRAAQAAAAMAVAAVNAAKKELDINSPSREFYRIGNYAGVGFINALGKCSTKAYDAGSEMAASARLGLQKSITRMLGIINGDEVVQPTIRPVIDLSDTKRGADAISQMFAEKHSFGIQANVTDIASMMNENQNRSTDGEIVSAINKLRNEMRNMPGDTYNLNGITYDDGTNIATAIKSLVRASIIERRV